LSNSSSQGYPNRDIRKKEYPAAQAEAPTLEAQVRLLEAQAQLQELDKDDAAITQMILPDFLEWEGFPSQEDLDSCHGHLSLEIHSLPKTRISVDMEDAADIIPSISEEAILILLVAVLVEESAAVELVGSEAGLGAAPAAA